MVMEEEGTISGLENFDEIMGRLGLSDHRQIPDPVHFNDTDALGACSVTRTKNTESTSSPVFIGKDMGNVLK